MTRARLCISSRQLHNAPIAFFFFCEDNLVFALARFAFVCVCDFHCEERETSAVLLELCEVNRDGTQPKNKMAKPISSGNPTSNAYGK